jgi:hypothetical protein
MKGIIGDDEKWGIKKNVTKGNCLARCGRVAVLEKKRHPGRTVPFIFGLLLPPSLTP